MTANTAALWINSTFLNFDTALTEFFHGLYNWGGDLMTKFMELISMTAHDGIPLIILSILLIIFKKTRRFGTAMLLSIAVGALITNCCLKVLIARPRPYTDVNSIFYKYWQMVGMNTESDKSFPSGHTTAAFALSNAVYLTGNRKKSWTAFIYAILIGISRIYLCVHYPSDVVAGIIVGLIGGAVGTLIASKLPCKFYGRDFYKLQFIDVQNKNKKLSDDMFSDDFKESESIGRCTFGKLGLYYNDLGKKYFSPYDFIDNAFIKVSECSEDEFAQNYSYFRLILENNKKEFANLIFDKKNEAEDALAKLKSLIKQ